MEFYEAVRRRRMVRNYVPDQVPDAAIERMLDAAQRAPSAGNSQGQSFVVITDEQTRHEIAALADEPTYIAKGFDPWISRAPVHVVICTSDRVYRDRYREPDKWTPGTPEMVWPVPYWWVDAGASLMALLLAAVVEGYAAGFLGTHAIGDLRSLLGIPADVHPIGVVTIGRPAPDRRSASLQRPRRHVVHRGRWTTDSIGS